MRQGGALAFALITGGYESYGTYRSYKTYEAYESHSSRSAHQSHRPFPFRALSPKASRELATRARFIVDFPSWLSLWRVNHSVRPRVTEDVLPLAHHTEGPDFT